MLTKVLTSLVLPPGSLLLLALLGVLLAWRGRRRLGLGLVAVALLALGALSLPVVAGALARGLEREHGAPSVEALPQADAIVVLGGALGPAIPPRHAPDLADSADRVLHAATLFAAGKAPVVIASGGVAAGAAGGPESEGMADLLVRLGVPREAIVLERDSVDTRTNAVETAALLEARDLGRVLLVTSALHMPRALATFRGVGVDAIPAPTDFEVVDAPTTALDWLPDAKAFALSTRALHEHLGRLYYHLRSW